MWVAGKYLALQVPGWVLLGLGLALLHDWGTVSTPVAIGAWVLWVAKDLALYPLVRHAYGNAPSRYVGADPLFGARGVAEDELAPEGFVRVRGERWRAELADPSAAPVPSGAPVRVTDVRGLTLRVEPETDPCGAAKGRH